MPGGVRSRQPWLYLGADWAASDILGPEKEAGGIGARGGKMGGERRKEVMSEGRSVSGRAEQGRARPELPEKTKRNSEEVKEKER